MQALKQSSYDFNSQLSALKPAVHDAYGGGLVCAADSIDSNAAPNGGAATGIIRVEGPSKRIWTTSLSPTLSFSSS